jgi:hypothetical protein
MIIRLRVVVFEALENCRIRRHFWLGSASFAVYDDLKVDLTFEKY